MSTWRCDDRVDVRTGSGGLAANEHWTMASRPIPFRPARVLPVQGKRGAQ